MANENVGVTITGQDVSAGAFNSANNNVNKLDQNIGRMASRGIRDMKQMTGSVVQFGEALASGDISGAIMGFIGLIVNGLKTITLQTALATAGLSVLVGAVILGIKSMTDADKEATEAAKRYAEERAKAQADYEKKIKDGVALYNELQISSMKEGFAKQRAEEEKHYQKRIDDNNNFYEAAKASDNDYVRAGASKLWAETDRLIQQEHANHLKKIQDEENKAAAERQAKKDEEAKKEAERLKKSEEDFNRALQEQAAIEEKNRLEKIKAKEQEEQAAKEQQDNFVKRMRDKETAQNNIDQISFNSHRQRLAEIAEQEEKQRQLDEYRIQGAYNAAGIIGSLAQNLNVVLSNEGKKQSRALFNIQKAATIAQIAITGSKAVMAATAWGWEIGGPVGAGIMAALAGGQVAAQIAAVATTKPPSFQTSEGMDRRVPGPSNREMLAVLHGGERINRDNGGMTLNFYGDVFNSEQTLNMIAKGLRDYQQRTGFQLIPS